MRLRRLSLLGLVASLGCINVYHPEYHPQASVTYVQNIAYPTTVVLPAAPSAAPPRVAGAERRAPRVSGKGPDHHVVEDTPPVVEQAPAAPTSAPWPASDPWQDMFEKERLALRARSLARGPLDDWERVTRERTRPEDRQTDVVVDVSLAQAKAVARRTPSTARVILEGQHTEHNATVAEVRRHPGRDGLAQVLMKLDEPAAGAAGTHVAVDFDLGDRRLFALGRVAGPAAESAYDALVRAGLCRWADRGRELQCRGSLRVARFDGAMD